MSDYDSSPRSREDRREFREEAESLFRITLGPVIWAAHFLVCYCSVAIACAKLDIVPAWQLAGLLAMSVLALAAIAWIGWKSFRQWDVGGGGSFSNPRSVPEDRHRFLGHAAFLLAVISGIGVIYVTLPLLLVGGCS